MVLFQMRVQRKAMNVLNAAEFIQEYIELIILLNRFLFRCTTTVNFMTVALTKVNQTIVYIMKYYISVVKKGCSCLVIRRQNKIDFAAQVDTLLYCFLLGQNSSQLLSFNTLLLFFCINNMVVFVCHHHYFYNLCHP